MSVLLKTSRQTATYLLFQVIGLGVSFVSFPVLTRILSLEEYGNLALVNSSLVLMLAVAKCGVTTAVIRQYPDHQSRQARASLFSSAFAGGVGLAAAILVVYYTALHFARGRMEAAFYATVTVAGGVLLVRISENLFLTFLRAEERVFQVNLLGLATKVLSLVAGISLALVFTNRLQGYFSGVVAAETGVALAMCAIYQRAGLLQVRAVSGTVMRRLYAFGFPLIVFEVSALVNDYSDRFLIKYFLDSSQLGIYSAGYNLGMYARGVITAPMWMTIVPLYSKLWKSEGREKTAEYLSDVLRYYVLAAALVVVVLTGVRRELITALAGARYGQAAEIIPFIIGSIMVYGSAPIIHAGFYLTDQTRRIAGYTLLCALLNFFANLYLIPRFGIKGAAYSSLLSYVLLTTLLARASMKILRLALPLRQGAAYVAAGLGTLAILGTLHFRNPLTGLFAKSAVGVLSYFALSCLLDSELRATIRGRLRDFAETRRTRRTP